MRAKITQRALESLRSKAVQTQKDEFLWDIHYRGFGAKCSAKGHISFVVQKFINGRSKRITIAHYPWCSIKDARDQAAVIVANIYLRKNSGFIPQSSTLINGDASKLLKLTFEEYFRRNSSDTKHWKYIYKNFTNIVIPYFGAQKRLTEITPKDIRALLQTRESKPQMMRIIYSNLRGFFNYCVMEEYLDRSPMDKIQAPKTSKPRKRYLAREEIKIFWDASQQLPYPHSQFYRFCLLTAQRNRHEVAKMRWDEISFEERIWRIPSSRSKNKHEHLVFLSDLALEVLNEIKDSTSPYVFTSKWKTPISDHSYIKREFDKISGLKHFVLHDLRRTMVTHLAELGVLPDVADRILNHVSTKKGVKGVYQIYEFFAERNEALQKYGEFVREIIK